MNTLSYYQDIEKNKEKVIAAYKEFRDIIEDPAECIKKASVYWILDHSDTYFYLLDAGIAERTTDRKEVRRRHVKGQSYEEISKALDLGIGQVRSYLVDPIFRPVMMETLLTEYLAEIPCRETSNEIVHALAEKYDVSDWDIRQILIDSGGNYVRRVGYSKIAAAIEYEQALKAHEDKMQEAAAEKLKTRTTEYSWT